MQNNTGPLTGGPSRVRPPLPPTITPPQILPPTINPPLVPINPVPVKPPIPPPTLPPPGAVTKGSFTVWAEPKNPKPFEAYEIVIEVKLPSNLPNYLRTDLSGNLIGTDTYKQNLGVTTHDTSFNFYGNKAILKIRVPGAVSKVRDDVQIQSVLLNEAQTISVYFQ